MSIAREMRALGIAGSFLNVTEDGKVTQATRQCLEIIAKHDMVLATSHIRPSEVLPVVKAAQEVGVKRIVITHPEFPTTLLSIAQQQELARLGVYFERCFTTPNTGKISWEQVYANIREVGPDSTILATDLGQTTAPYPGRRPGHVRRAACSTTASPSARCARWCATTLPQLLGRDARRPRPPPRR